MMLLMNKSRARIMGVIAVVLVVLVLGVFLFHWQSEDRSPSLPAHETATVTNLGITYLPLTPKLSTYYELGVDSGVLVTEIVSGSPMERAGVQVGDVILSCDGIKLDRGVSLLGIMKACCCDRSVVLEVCRERCSQVVECRLYFQTPDSN